MTSRDFAYWLQGYFEIANPKEIKEEQLAIIKKHLDLVFFHDIDPSYTDDKEKIAKMNEIHNGKHPGASKGKSPLSFDQPQYPNDGLLRC